jgi:DNA-binding response OmpR family regulator
MTARILIVEDDALLALDVVRVLESAGFAVVGPAGSSAKALDLIAKVGCDAAVLDINLGRNVTSEPVAVELIAQGKRFVTVTGYSHDQRPSIYDGHPILTKPLRRGALVAELNRLLAA